jgi:Protein of unknown function (DUF3108)
MSSPSAIPSETSTTQQMARDIVRRQGLFATTKRKLIAALIASLVLHLIAGVFLRHEEPEDKIVPLIAKFVKLPPPPTAPTAVAKAKPKPKPRPQPQANSAVASLPTVAEPPAIEPPPVEEKKAEVAPEPKPEPVPEPVVAKETPKEEPKSAPAAEVAANLPPKKIQLGYTAFLGEQRSELGPVQLDFTHENGRYKLKISGRVKGLAALLYPGIYKGESEGTITADGLRPDKFVEERGSPDKRREVLFDYVNRKIVIPEKEPISFEGAAHDTLTWIVQFYFAMPKSEEATFSVASTRRIDVYTLKRDGKDNLSTPIGNVDVQIWKGARKPREDGSGAGGSAQFWLAPEWHFIPFQIKLVNAQGRSAYLELTAINTE